MDRAVFLLVGRSSFSAVYLGLRGLLHFMHAQVEL